jgi:hypothetical protein
MELNHARVRVTLIGMLAAISGMAVLGLRGATPEKAPNVTYAASGTFASPPISGEDTLKLAGEPFAITIVANAGSVPVKHGRNWAVLNPFKMTGTVHSGLLGATPIEIASDEASIYETVGPDYDPFETGFPVDVVGIKLTVRAQITLPAGSLPRPLIHPFAAVTLTPANATVSYTDGTNVTVLGIETGTLAATIPTVGNLSIKQAGLRIP